ncbi:hypothetical protein NEFER03_0836 [Nematocida sp. LUAm3]|nr:hypothetical protein NEFER03_0836 [Nematocida sp. LUAm3]KAI5174854.1 hypothetical protein NEFER02_0954 [Nematocida sp. LUAm2]KAI5177548.1 hypothetical protein NEFER01_0798 [Nematocida sp. LUAm1]
MHEYVVNVVAHVDHGKTTFMDNVLEHIGILSKSTAGEARLLDSRKDEVERGMTMKISPITVRVGESAITFLDTPGHLEFNSLTLSTFIICDTSLVLVDIVDGVTERLKGLLEQVRENRGRIILCINKVDVLLKMNVSLDEIEYKVEEIVQEVEREISHSVSWKEGGVVICSAKDNWAVSSASCLSKILGKPQEKEITVKKSLSLAKKVYELKEEELLRIAERVEMTRNRQIKRCPKPGEILSHIFGFFSVISKSIIREQSEESCSVYRKDEKEYPESVLGVICANTLVLGEVTGILRLMKNRRIAVGDEVWVQEGEETEKRKITKIIRFLKNQETVEEGTGLVGVQGLSSRKRGVLSLEITEEVKEFYRALPWKNFSPLFIDIIRCSDEVFPEVLRRVSLLSRCEPGMFCSLTEMNEITVQSDGNLQLDKIKTDLEGLEYKIEENSSVHYESVEGGKGFLQINNHVFSIKFKGLFSDNGERNTMKDNACAVQYGRNTYGIFSADVPNEIKRVVGSLMKKGPFLHSPCMDLLVTVEKEDENISSTADIPPIYGHINLENTSISEEESSSSEKQYEQLNAASKPIHTSSIYSIYLNSSPRLLLNHTMVLLSIPSSFSKSISICIPNYQANILSSEHTDKRIFFKIKIPIQEIRGFITHIRSLTKGEGNVLLEKEVFFSLPENRAYEDLLTVKIREDKGIYEREKIFN